MSEIQKIAEFLKQNTHLYLTNTKTGQLMSFCDVTKSVTPLENAGLNEFLRPGDIVMMNAEKGRIKEKIPNGTFGVVTGYCRYQRAVGYNELWYSKKKGSDGIGLPGVFEKNDSAKITWINGETSQGHAGDIYNVTNDSGHKRENAKAFQEEYETPLFIKDLPELPIWPGDTVGVNQVFYCDPAFNEESKQMRIERIDYNNADTKCLDGSPLPIYTIGPLHTSGPSMDVREYIEMYKHQDDSEKGRQKVQESIRDEIHIVKLIERGNYWAWFNDKSKLNFKTFEEEARFYVSLGVLQEIPSSNGGYRLSSQEVVDRLANGEICYLEALSWNRAGKFKAWNIPGNPELKERFRQKTAEQYDFKLNLKNQIEEK